MVDWQSPLIVARLAAAQMPVLFFCIGVTMYDQLCLLGFDINLLRAHRRRKMPLVAYFGAKVSWWVYAVLCIISVMGDGPYNCMGIIRSLEFFMACVAVCSSALLAIRTVCVWQNEKAKQVVAWSVGIFGVALAGVWFAGVADIEAMWVPNGGGAWQKGACAPVKVEMRYFVKYIVTILFDLFVLILTVAGVFRMSTNGRTRIGALLVQQGLFYFLATFAANLLPAVITILQLSPYMSLYFAVPSSFVAVVASTRLYVQLAREATAHNGSQGRHQHVPYSNHTGSNISEKLSNFMRRKSTATPGPGMGGMGMGMPPASPSTAVGTAPRRKQAPAFYASAQQDDSLTESYGGSASDLEKQHSHGHGSPRSGEVGLDSSIAHGVTTSSEADAPVLPVAPFVAALDMHGGSQSTLHGGGQGQYPTDVAPQSPPRRNQIPHPFSAAAQSVTNAVRSPRAEQQAQLHHGQQQQQQQQQRGGRGGHLTGIIVEQTREEMSE